jgi:hypothetical protein
MGIVVSILELQAKAEVVFCEVPIGREVGPMCQMSAFLDPPHLLTGPWSSPRVIALMAAWPDAATTSGFRRRLDTGMLAEIINWLIPGCLTQIDEITNVLKGRDIAIETVQDFRGKLTDPGTRPALREALKGV